MAIIVKDRVRVTTTTTGTGTITLGSAVQSFQNFFVIGDGNQTYYAIVDSTSGGFEVGVGTFTASGTTLSRDTVLESSNANAKVNFGSGTKDVFVTYPSDRSVSQADVGTNPNQLPLNQYLGDLAYQTAVAVNISGGIINDVVIGGATPAAGSFTTVNASSTVTLDGLTASQAVFTNASKELVSNAITGTGNVVMSTSPTLVTPALGTPSAAVLTNATGLPVSTGISGLGTGVATFLATPSSANLASAVTGETGTGALVFASTPTLVTPVLGVATATSVNKVTITAPATSATLTIANSKTLTANNTLTLSGTDATTMTFPSTSATIARTDAGQTFTGTQVMTSPRIVTGVNDTNGNELFLFTATGSAVNEVTLANAATGNAPKFTASGGDTNIDLVVSAKGTGQVKETVSSVNYALASQFDIGTAPNEIPLNQYLGSMAYLDADNISFDARGTNTAAQNLAINKLTTVVISADTTLTTTVPLIGSTAFVIVITSGATSRTVTFGTGFKSTGTLATGTTADRRFVFQFISDGTNLVEVSRTAAITY